MKRVLVYTNAIREIYITSEGKIEWVSLKSGMVTNIYRGMLTKPYKKSDGLPYYYYSINARNSKGKQRLVPVSRLVYEAFIGKIPRGLMVKHKDGDILNNDYQNLYLERPNASSRVYK